MWLQILIALDQLINALIGGTADETLSARSYRAHRDGKLFGKITMPVINALFFWQGPDHCFHAYRKEHERQNLPNEYRPAQAGFFTPGRGD